MAKSKKRKRGPSRRAEGSTATAGRGAAPRQEKHDRKEEARRQREALRRRATRRRLLWRTGFVVAITAVVALIALQIVRQETAARRRAGEEPRLLAQASAAAQAAGCTDVQTVAPDLDGDQQHVTSLPALSSYPSQPPASGPHNPTPLGAGVYSSPPSIGEAIHSLEHGAVDVWYSPSASGPEVDRLRQFFIGDDHVIVAPYSYSGSGGKLPDGRQMALVAWHRIRYCDGISLPVAAAFVHDYRFDGAHPELYGGEAPEAGAPI